MGITLDNSIRLLEDYHKWEKQHGIFGSGVDDATNKLLEAAKKYQKIEYLAERYEAHTKGIPDKGPRAMMNDILKIVKGEKE